MTAIQQDFIMYSGDTKKLTVTVTDEDGAVDLTGASIRWGFARDTTLTIKSLADGGIAVTDVPGGVFQITIEPEDTEHLNGKYLHEAEVIDAGGQISTVLVGYMTVLKSILQ